MTLLERLVLISPIVTITANVTVLYCVVPAFKRTRNRAFLWLGIAALLGTFDTVCDYSLGHELLLKSPADYGVYRIVRRFTYFTTCGLSATGTVQLALAALNAPRPDAAAAKKRYTF